MARNRIRRKDLKQPDQFVTLGARTLEWAKANRTLATWGAIAAVVLIIAIGATASYRSSRLRQSNADLGRALLAFRGEASSTATQQLVEAARRWKGTSAGKLAAVVAANSEVRLRNYESAANILSEFQPELAQLPAYFQQELLFAWGAALESKGDWKEATAKYHAAAVLEGPYTALASLGEARALENSEQVDQAREIYRRVHEQFPDLPSRELIRLKAGL